MILEKQSELVAKLEKELDHQKKILLNGSRPTDQTQFIIDITNSEINRIKNVRRVI